VLTPIPSKFEKLEAVRAILTVNKDLQAELWSGEAGGGGGPSGIDPQDFLTRPQLLGVYELHADILQPETCVLATDPASDPTTVTGSLNNGCCLLGRLSKFCQSQLSWDCSESMSLDQSSDVDQHGAQESLGVAKMEGGVPEALLHEAAGARGVAVVAKFPSSRIAPQPRLPGVQLQGLSDDLHRFSRQLAVTADVALRWLLSTSIAPRAQ